MCLRRVLEAFRERSENMEKKTKQVYFEIIRIVACFLVIYNHLPGFHIYVWDPTLMGIKQAIYMFSSIISKVSVPFFFMVSGALLLGRKETMQQILKKRVSRILIVMVISEFVMYYLSNYVYYCNEEPYTFSFITFLRGVIGCEIYAVPYWYLYTYLGFLLCLPFLQRAAERISRFEFWFLVFFMFLRTTFEPILNLFLSLADQDPVWLSGYLSFPFAMETAIFFPLMGYYLDHCVDITKIKAKHVILYLQSLFPVFL